MKDVLIRLALLGMGGFAGWTVLTGLGRGEMMMLTKGGPRARRDARPVRFWTYALFNAVMTAVLLFVALLPVARWYDAR